MDALATNRIVAGRPRGRPQRHIKGVCCMDDATVVGADDVAAALRRAGDVVQGPEASAHTILGLNHFDLVTPALENQGRIEPRESGTHHQHFASRESDCIRRSHPNREVATASVKQVSARCGVGHGRGLRALKRANEHIVIRLYLFSNGLCSIEDKNKWRVWGYAALFDAETRVISHIQGHLEFCLWRYRLP